MPTCSRTTSTAHSATIRKAMIRELGNVELFELCETIPKVQCSHCLLYCKQGIVNCTCGQCLFDSESRRKFYKRRLDAHSIPHYVIKKGRCHGARHGKTNEQIEYRMARMRGRDAATKLTQKVNISQVFTIDFSEIQFVANHNSQSDGQNKSAKSGTNSQKKTIHIVIPRTMISHLEQVRQKWADATSIRFSSCSHNQKPSPS